MSGSPATSDETLWRTFLEKFRHARKVILIISSLMLVIEHLGWVHGLETLGLDSFLRGKNRRMSTDVFIVEITDEDYVKHFGATSPLRPDRVKDLVERIATAGPKVIGIDLDTSSDGFRRLQPKTNMPLIWATVAEPLESDRSAFQPGPVLGGALSDPESMGIVSFPVDPDGIVRRYRRQFKTKTAAVPHMRSFACAVLKSYRPELHRTDEEVIFNFSGDRYAFPTIGAEEFFGSAPNSSWETVLGNKVVLLGGRYAAARDEYLTPLGPMAGVELIAHALESDLHGPGIRKVSWILGWVLDVFAGTLVVFLFAWKKNRPRQAFWYSLLALPAGLMIGSLIVFRTKAYWVNFGVVVVSLVMHQLYDRVEDLAELEETRKELTASRGRIKQLEAEHSPEKTALAAEQPAAE